MTKTKMSKVIMIIVTASLIASCDAKSASPKPSSSPTRAEAIAPKLPKLLTASQIQSNKEVCGLLEEQLNITSSAMTEVLTGPIPTEALRAMGLQTFLKLDVNVQKELTPAAFGKMHYMLTTLTKVGTETIKQLHKAETTGSRNYKEPLSQHLEAYQLVLEGCKTEIITH